MEDNENEDNLSLKDKLKKIGGQIKHSWLKDCDETKYMIQLTKMIEEMLTKETLEEYFSNNEGDLNYFMGDFFQEVLQYLLIQPIIYGQNGDEIGMDLLVHIFKLFLKFHKNKKYAPLFERIRDIFHSNSSRSFFKSDSNKNDNPIKKYDCSKFNEVYNLDFSKKKQTKKFEIGDEVDIPIDISSSKSIEKKTWVRGRIKDIVDDEYIIDYGESYRDKKISKNNFNIYPAGEKTVDWEWRTNLQKYDVIDCFDRSKWYPSTILKVEKEEVNGIQKVNYRIGFRLYPEHFKNLEDETDTYDKHLDFWKESYFSDNQEKDSEGEKFFGDRENFDETIIHYSKRIQKFNTFTKCQQKYLNYSYNGSSYYYNRSEENNPMKLMNEKLENDTDISMEDFYNYEVNGKKNVILVKSEEFEAYFALFLKNIENEGCFTKFIEILQDKPNSEEIYNIFYILLHSFSYIHKDYFRENSSIIKNSLINFINSLDNKEMRNLQKDLIDIVTELLKKISAYSDANDKDNSFEDLYDELTLTLSIKTIKTSIFDRRLQGIKALNDYIEKNSKNKTACLKLINLIKKNEIIQEIFGANYHSQIINKSTEIVKLLLLENELNEEDIKLIWSCTKKGDLEAKVTILKLLSDIADNLKEEYIEMLLNSIKSNIDKKIDEKEIDLVYKLSIQGKNNDKNMLLCCDYLCQCLLSLNNPDIKNNHILDKLLVLVSKDDKCLQKVLEICENCLKKNENSLLSYSILFEIMDKIHNNSEPIENLKKEKHLIDMFEDNFKLYTKQAKELLEHNKIPSSDGDIIDKYLINGFPHSENIKKRMELFPYLINYYKDYDFLPFLKEVLVNNAVSPNDQSIFFEFIKNYISNDDSDDNDNDNELNLENESNNLKMKIRQELFDLISEDNQKDVTMEQLKLFMALFYKMNQKIIKLNKEDDNNGIGNESIDVENIDELKGLDKLWNIIFKIKNVEVLSTAINMTFQLYKNKNLDKLLEKCNNLIKEDNVPSEMILKCITLLRLIITESEKNKIFKPKSHSSLPKNCLINLPLKLERSRYLDDGEDTDKHLLFGNTTINDLKIIISKMHKYPAKSITFELSDEY